jgi:hypothetical protein
MAQVDCSELPDFQLRKFLPGSGVLHFFVNWEVFDGLDEAQSWPNHVVFSRGTAESWHEVGPPADLPPCYGASSASYKFPWLEHTDRRLRDYPTAFPKKAMTMGVARTFAEEHPKELDGNSAGRYQQIWEEEQTAELARFYGDPVVAEGLPGPKDEFPLVKRTVQRPTTTFPAAWIDIEVFCGLFLTDLLERGMQRIERGKDACGQPWPPATALPFRVRLARALCLRIGGMFGYRGLVRTLGERLGRTELTPAGVQAAYEDAMAGANAWIERSRSAGLTSPVPEADRTAFWSWLDGMNAASVDATTDSRSAGTQNRLIWQAVRTGAHICLADEAALSLVPPEMMGELRMEHSVLVAEKWPRRAGRHQMLGAGRDVQGQQRYHTLAAGDERLGDVLLMQLDTDWSFPWILADCGVLQYWISLSDLRAERFDRVRVTLEGH